VGDTRFQVREANLADIDVIMTLESSGFAIGIREKREVFLGRIATFPQGFMIASDGMTSDVFGYICGELWPFRMSVTEKDFAVDHNISVAHASAGSELYISSMTIRPDYRNRRLGAWLFVKCIEHAREACPQIASVILMVNDTWTHARRIYASQGFAEIAHFPDFFQPVGIPAQGASIMRRFLLDS
jgi:ribosomal-protein-alanine N-acetyltransferase